MSVERERAVRAIQTIYQHGYSKGASDEVWDRFDFSIAAESYLDTKPIVVTELLALLPQREVVAWVSRFGSQSRQLDFHKPTDDRECHECRSLTYLDPEEG